MIEIGSYLELDLRNTGELYSGPSVCRLNTDRAGMYHCCCLLGVKKVCLPWYECFTVRDFLIKKGIEVCYYHIDKNFVPIDPHSDDDTAIIFVNYFGLMNEEHMLSVIKGHKNVIIDNAQALFAKPIMGCLNVYSARKFVGVPDGCYVVGKDVNRFVNEYPEDCSSETCDFLLKRHEVGCNAAYPSRMKNEDRIDNADIMRMSKLSQAILRNAPYRTIRNKRQKNLQFACELYKDINLINPMLYADSTCVPFVYPLVVEDAEMVSKLAKENIFTGRWWSYLLSETSEDTMANYLSRFLIPIPIDQRYGKKELKYVRDMIVKLLEL